MKFAWGWTMGGDIVLTDERADAPLVTVRFSNDARELDRLQKTRVLELLLDEVRRHEAPKPLHP